MGFGCCLSFCFQTPAKEIIKLNPTPAPPATPLSVRSQVDHEGIPERIHLTNFNDDIIKMEIQKGFILSILIIGLSIVEARCRL